MRPVIGFCGMGHLGQHSKAAAHIKGFECVTYEFGKTGDCAEDLAKCDIVYICPDRPNHHVGPEVFVDIALRNMKPGCVLVVLCQVEPGFTRKIKWKNLYYQVETLKVNNEALERALNPERIVIGHRADGMPLHKALREFVEVFDCPVIEMSYEAAELTKIAINIYLASQIQTSNRLARIASRLDLNWDVIIPALRADKRIGEHAYLKPGTLGQHLERDMDAIAKLEKTLGCV
jgi:UDPglucose 6-dehydrogenase